MHISNWCYLSSFLFMLLEYLLKEDMYKKVLFDSTYNGTNADMEWLSKTEEE